MSSKYPKKYQIKSAKGGGEDVGKIDWVIPDSLPRGSLVLPAAEKGTGISTLIYKAAESVGMDYRTLRKYVRDHTDATNSLERQNKMHKIKAIAK